MRFYLAEALCVVSLNDANNLSDDTHQKPVIDLKLILLAPLKRNDITTMH